jgi:hypothetical protein
MLRKTIEYSNKNKRRMKRASIKALLDFEDLTDDAEDKGKVFIHNNQLITAKHIVANFCDRKIINQMCLGLTQSGKTGTMLAVIKMFLTDKSNTIDINNIFVITGFSSNDWKKQTKGRFPDSLEKNIFHRGELQTKFAEAICGKQNILLIIDEIQVASKNEQTVHKTFKQIGFYDFDFMIENDIKLLEFTATPDGTIYSMKEWEQNQKVLQCAIGDGYTSCFDMLKKNQIKQSNKIYKFTKITGVVDIELFDRNAWELLTDIANSGMRYSIIRGFGGDDQTRFVNLFKNMLPEGEYNYVFFDTDNDKKEAIKNGKKKAEAMDINDILKIKPDKTTLIFIKEKLRCAKTLDHKENIGVVYERYSNTFNDSSIIQSLLGRITGYGKVDHIIIYSNIDTINRYQQLWDCCFTDKKIKWNSLTTKSRGGITKEKLNYKSKENFENNGEGAKPEEKREPVIKPFKNQEDAKIFFKNVLKLKEKFKNTTGPRKKKINVDGFYHTVLGKEVDKKRARTTAEIKHDRRWNLDDSHKYTFYPCYENLNDKSTLEWLLIYYE